MIKNPNWQEATSWLFTKRGKVESGSTGNKSKSEVRTDSRWNSAAGLQPRANKTPYPLDHAASFMLLLDADEALAGLGIRGQPTVFTLGLPLTLQALKSKTSGVPCSERSKRSPRNVPRCKQQASQALVWNLASVP